MSNDLKDILSNSNKDIDNQKLMDYLSHQLSGEDLHDIEKEMVDDPFMNDAVEGLQEVRQEKNLEAYVEQLNDNLTKQLAKNKARKNKRKFKDQPYVYLAVILLLILMVVCFLVVKKQMAAKNKVAPTTSEVISATSKAIE